jgi:hypothetical protein
LRPFFPSILLKEQYETCHYCKKIFAGFLLSGASFSHAQAQLPTPPSSGSEFIDSKLPLYTLQGKLGGVEFKGNGCQIMALVPDSPHKGLWYPADASFCQHARTAYILNADIGLHLRTDPRGMNAKYEGFWVHQP